MRRTIILIVLGLSSPARAQPSSAEQAYPTKPVRVVVAFAAGGLADSVARLIGARLSERLGQTIVVDNRGGAGRNIGSRIVAGAAAAAGYTLLVNTAAIAINPTLYRSPGFDIYKDFVPVALTGSTPGLFAVNAEINTILDMVDVNSRLDGMGLETKPGTPAAFAAYLESEVGKWAKIIKTSGIVAD